MRNIFVFSFLCLLATSAQSQNFHFAARFGMANYQGDLKKNSFSVSQPGLMGSIGARYDLTERITARSYLSFGRLRADDKKGTDVMKQRNLNFKSNLWEFELSAQYSIFSLNEKWWSPYVFAGAGFYHFKPYTEVEGEDKTFLKPLSTEGQGFLADVKEYKLTQFAVPVGVGAQYALNEDMRIGLELGYRKIFTDYLDDVSANYADQTALLNARGQTAVDFAWRGDEVGAGPYPAAGTSRGNPANNDGYMFISLTYTVRFYFDKYKEIAGIPIGSSKSKKVGCPSTRY